MGNTSAENASNQTGTRNSTDVVKHASTRKSHRSPNGSSEENVLAGQNRSAADDEQTDNTTADRSRTERDIGTIVPAVIPKTRKSSAKEGSANAVNTSTGNASAADGNRSDASVGSS